MTSRAEACQRPSVCLSGEHESLHFGLTSAPSLLLLVPYPHFPPLTLSTQPTQYSPTVLSPTQSRMPSGAATNGEAQAYAQLNGVIAKDQDKQRVPVHTFDPDASPEEKASKAGKGRDKLDAANVSEPGGKGKHHSVISAVFRIVLLPRFNNGDIAHAGSVYSVHPALVPVLHDRLVAHTTRTKRRRVCRLVL